MRQDGPVPTLRDVWFWPPGGRADRMWLDSPEADSVARSAQRICASFSERLGPRRIASPRGSIQLTVADGELTDGTVDVEEHSSPDGYGASISVPAGFHTLPTDVRTDVIAEAVLHAVLLIADRYGLDRAAIEAAMQEAAHDGLEWASTGPWKASPDRRRSARLTGRLLDDGYMRTAIEIREGRDGPTRSSEAFLGVENPSRFRNHLKTLEWDGPDVVSAGVNVDHLLFGRIDIDAATGVTLGRWRHHFNREPTGLEVAFLGSPQGLAEAQEALGEKPGVPLEMTLEPIDHDPPVRANDGDPRRVIARPAVRTAPRRLVFLGTSDLDGAPRDYGRRIRELEAFVEADVAWRSWWTAAGLFDVDIETTVDAAKPGLTVRIAEDRVVARLRRPRAIIPRGPEARTLATDDFSRLIERIRARGDLPEPPPFSGP
jgi:hypothetical protein